MKLLLNCKTIDHPFGHETQAQQEVWADIKINIVDDENQLICSIVDIQWDIVPLLDWIALNHSAILNDNFPFQEIESLAFSVQQFYEEKIPDDSYEDLSEEVETMIDQLDIYKRSHGLIFALRGVAIDNIYIGKFNDVMTVSLFNESKNWSYEVDIHDFLTEASYIAKALL